MAFSSCCVAEYLSVAVDSTTSDDLIRSLPVPESDTESLKQSHFAADDRYEETSDPCWNAFAEFRRRTLSLCGGKDAKEDSFH